MNWYVYSFLSTVYEQTLFSIRVQEGRLPTALGDLELMRVLYLDSNLLTGPIPESIGRMRQLGTLHGQSW